MLTKTKIALAALALFTVAGTSATLASDHEDQSGGFVMPGSMDGVNPVFHPEWFGSRANGSGHTNGRGAFASTRRSKAGRARGQDAFGLAGEGAAAGYNGTFMNGIFIPRGTSPAQVPAYREED